MSSQPTRVFWSIVLATGLAACGASTPPTGPTSGAGGATGFTPAPAATASGPTGSYELTLTASPSCVVVRDSVGGQMLPMPETALVRRYQAEFTDGTARLTAADGTGNRVLLGGIDGYAYPGLPLMTLEAETLTIIVPPRDGGGYIVATPSCAGGDYWWEPFDDAQGTGAFESCGTWIGKIQASGNIEGTVSGSFGYYLGRGPNWSTNLFCRATDHRFTLVKR
jgi:hypothetical protein